MKPTSPSRINHERVCYDTLPWLISFSLEREAERASEDNEQDS